MDSTSEIFRIFEALSCNTQPATKPQDVHFLQPGSYMVPTGNRLGYQTFFFVVTLVWLGAHRGLSTTLGCSPPALSI